MQFSVMSKTYIWSWAGVGSYPSAEMRSGYSTAPVDLVASCPDWINTYLTIPKDFVGFSLQCGNARRQCSHVMWSLYILLGCYGFGIMMFQVSNHAWFKVTIWCKFYWWHNRCFYFLFFFKEGVIKPSAYIWFFLALPIFQLKHMVPLYGLGL